MATGGFITNGRLVLQHTRATPQSKLPKSKRIVQMGMVKKRGQSMLLPLPPPCCIWRMLLPSPDAAAHSELGFGVWGLGFWVWVRQMQQPIQAHTQILLIPIINTQDTPLWAPT